MPLLFKETRMLLSPRRSTSQYSSGHLLSLSIAAINMASSAQNHQQHFPTTSAPPPTPSITQPSDSAATDLISRLLHRLPPTLSTTPILLRRRSSLAATTPVISFPDLTSSLSSTLTSVSESGFFQLTNHSIPSELAHSAESDSLSLFNLPSHQKHQHFPRSWPLGFDDDDEEDAGAGDSLFLDSSCSTDSSELSLDSLREFTREMEKIGLAVVEALSCAMGLQNPARDDPSSVCSLMWISDSSGSPGDTMAGSGKLYPFVVGLHYQIRSQNCSLLADSGSVSISTQMDSILVTLGDIAQVWSNGKLNKVRGKPILNREDSTSLTMSLLVTLPLESTVSLLPRVAISDHGGTDIECHVNRNEDDDDDDETSEESKFNSFSFEDYAWRVYHDRVPHKDPLDRYRIQT